ALARGPFGPPARACRGEARPTNLRSSGASVAETLSDEDPTCSMPYVLAGRCGLPCRSARGALRQSPLNTWRQAEQVGRVIMRRNCHNRSRSLGDARGRATSRLATWSVHSSRSRRSMQSVECEKPSQSPVSPSRSMQQRAPSAEGARDLPSEPLARESPELPQGAAITARNYPITARHGRLAAAGLD